MSGTAAIVTDLTRACWDAVAPGTTSPTVETTGRGSLPSVFAVTELATASIATAATAAARLVDPTTPPTVTVDRELASEWFRLSIRPVGWSLPPVWDPIAGDYRARDGWIRLHTNAPHHRDAALAVLRVAADRDAVTAAVATWVADDLEAAVVGAGGCAAAMRDIDAWRAHPQGSAIATEPLITWTVGTRPDASTESTAAHPDPGRPLAGIRVLDLTRVLAGPVATRFLAGLGATVLRIDPPDWEEPAVVPEVTLGKRCAGLDLHDAEDLATFRALLRDADVIVHGYRPDALARLGLGAAARQELRPGLVDVSLDAYGWTGPWAGRRGFDSLVQMSSGIAAAGMSAAAAAHPVPLPAQALDHATGYLLAAAAIRGLDARRAGIGPTVARLSLARTAALLIDTPAPSDTVPITGAPRLADPVETTTWGPARRLAPPFAIEGAHAQWDLPATALRTRPPRWE